MFRYCRISRARKHFVVGPRYGCRPNPNPNPNPNSDPNPDPERPKLAKNAAAPLSYGARKTLDCGPRFQSADHADPIFSTHKKSSKILANTL